MHHFSNTKYLKPTLNYESSSFEYDFLRHKINPFNTSSSLDTLIYPSLSRDAESECNGGNYEMQNKRNNKKKNKECAKQFDKKEINKMLNIVKSCNGDTKAASLLFPEYSAEDLDFIYESYNYRSLVKKAFTPEEDEKLISLTNTYGLDFKRITKFFKNRTICEIKKRYHKLNNLSNLIPMEKMSEENGCEMSLNLNNTVNDYDLKDQYRFQQIMRSTTSLNNMRKDQLILNEINNKKKAMEALYMALYSPSISQVSEKSEVKSGSSILMNHKIDQIYHNQKVDTKQMYQEAPLSRKAICSPLKSFCPSNNFDDEYDNFYRLSSTVNQYEQNNDCESSPKPEQIEKTQKDTDDFGFLYLSNQKNFNFEDDADDYIFSDNHFSNWHFQNEYSESDNLEDFMKINEIKEEKKSKSNGQEEVPKPKETQYIPNDREITKKPKQAKDVISISNLSVPESCGNHDTLNVSINKAFSQIFTLSNEYTSQYLEKILKIDNQIILDKTKNAMNSIDCQMNELSSVFVKEEQSYLKTSNPEYIKSKSEKIQNMINLLKIKLSWLNKIDKLIEA